MLLLTGEASQPALPRHSLALTVKSLEVVNCDPFLHRAMKEFHPFILGWPELV